MSEEKIRKSVPKKRGNRTGFTTGACAAAAAKAATMALVTGEPPSEIECRLPNGQIVRFPVHEARFLDADACRAVVVKDAGDDPDATHGAHLTVEVRRLPGRAGVIELRGGEGVGVVTKPGLGLEVSGPAINPVPRRNITENVQAAAGELLRTRVDVWRGAQNQELMQRMDRRADLQLRLQHTVEGLSVVAISYYAVGLLGYATYPLAAALHMEKPLLTAALTPLVVLAVWWGMRRVRARLHDAAGDHAGHGDL